MKASEKKQLLDKMLALAHAKNHELKAVRINGIYDLQSIGDAGQRVGYVDAMADISKLITEMPVTEDESANV